MIFLPGVSGNPAGRSKQGNSISDHFRSLVDLPDSKFEEILQYLERKQKGKRLGRITLSRLIACRVLVMARDGNLEAAKVLLERLEGRIRDESALVQLPSITVNTNILVTGSTPGTAEHPKQIQAGQVSQEEPD